MRGRQPKVLWKGQPLFGARAPKPAAAPLDMPPIGALLPGLAAPKAAPKLKLTMPTQSELKGQADCHNYLTRLTYGDRATFAGPVEWTKDGVPDFGRPQPVGTPIPVPAGEK